MQLIDQHLPLFFLVAIGVYLIVQLWRISTWPAHIPLFAYGAALICIVLAHLGII